MIAASPTYVTLSGVTYGDQSAFFLYDSTATTPSACQNLCSGTQTGTQSCVAAELYLGDIYKCKLYSNIVGPPRTGLSGYTTYVYVPGWDKAAG